MPTLKPLEELDPSRFDTPVILKKLASSSRQLAELKGMAASIPNQGILINTLGLQEAKDSSEIENIVTTHDELFKGDLQPDAFANPAAKEVLRYRQALRFGSSRCAQAACCRPTTSWAFRPSWSATTRDSEDSRARHSRTAEARRCTRRRKTRRKSWSSWVTSNGS